MTKKYTIQEASEITGISVHTLRFYERIGLLHIARAENRHRRYSDTDLGWIRFVMLLRATGMPLPQIAEFKQLEIDGQTTINKRLHMLEAHRTDLLQHVAELQNHVNALDNKIDYYQNTSAEVCDCVNPSVQIQEMEEVETHAISPIRTNGHQSESLMFRVNDIRERDREG